MMIYRLQIHVFENVSKTEVVKEEQIWEIEAPRNPNGVNPLLLQSETPERGIQNNVFSMESEVDDVATFYPFAGHIKNFPLLADLPKFGFKRVA